MRDVARLAGVGTSTASRFFRGLSVSAKASERVRRAAEELGYEPDQTAMALRSGRSKTIGVIIPEVNNTFFSEAVQVIQREVEAYGSAVTLYTHQEDLSRQMMQLLSLRRYRADGILLAPVAGSIPAEIERIADGTPLVTFDRAISSEISSVLLRNRDAARMATEHLLRHGYRSIGCVTARPELYTFTERKQGYAETMKAAGLTPWFIESRDYEQLRFQLSSLLASKKRLEARPEALLSLSNMAAVSILKAYEELGLSAKTRLPFLSFDDTVFGPLVNPPITVVRQPLETMVRYALDKLFRLIESKDEHEPQSIALPAELVCRRSCGCS